MIRNFATALVAVAILLITAATLDQYNDAHTDASALQE